MSPGNAAVDTLFRYLDEQRRREFQDRHRQLFGRAGISLDELLAALPWRQRKRLHDTMPDDLGEWDAIVFSTIGRLSGQRHYEAEEEAIRSDMSIIDASGLIEDMRRARDLQCAAGHHDMFHSQEPAGSPKITWGYLTCRNCGAVHHRVGPDRHWVELLGPQRPLLGAKEPAVLGTNTYRTISTPPEAIVAAPPRRPWWRRLLGLG